MDVCGEEDKKEYEIEFTFIEELDLDEYCKNNSTIVVCNDDFRGVLKKPLLISKEYMRDSANWKNIGIVDESIMKGTHKLKRITRKTVATVRTKRTFDDLCGDEEDDDEDDNKKKRECVNNTHKMSKLNIRVPSGKSIDPSDYGDDDEKLSKIERKSIRGNSIFGDDKTKIRIRQPKFSGVTRNRDKDRGNEDEDDYVDIDYERSERNSRKREIDEEYEDIDYTKISVDTFIEDVLGGQRKLELEQERKAINGSFKADDMAIIFFYCDREKSLTLDIEFFTDHAMRHLNTVQIRFRDINYEIPIEHQPQYIRDCVNNNFFLYGIRHIPVTTSLRHRIVWTNLHPFISENQKIVYVISFGTCPSHLVENHRISHQSEPLVRIVEEFSIFANT